MLQEFLEHANFLFVEILHDLLFAKFRCHLLPLYEHLLYLNRVIRKEFGRRVDTGQSAAYDDSGQPNL